MRSAARAAAAATLDNGAAWAKFRAWIAAQGGALQAVDEPSRLARAPIVAPLPAPRAGYVAQIDAREVGFTVFVDPGRREYVRRINVGGNTKSRDEVIRREMRQLEGGWYDAAAINRSKTRIDRLGFFDFLVRTVTDEDRLAAPLGGQRHARLQAGDIDLDGGKRQRGRIRAHLVDERPGYRYAAHDARHTGGQVKEIAASGLAQGFACFLVFAHG